MKTNTLRKTKKPDDYKVVHDTQRHDIDHGEHACNDHPPIEWSLLNRPTLKLKK